jgi:hypothetical protein
VAEAPAGLEPTKVRDLRGTATEYTSRSTPDPAAMSDAQVTVGEDSK